MQKNHLSSVAAVLSFKVEEVWQALINPDHVKKYFFGTIMETSWLPGTPIIFRGEWEGQSYMDKGTVLSFVPDESLSYSYLSSWSGLPDEPQNYLYVEYKLRVVDSGTELTITQSNYDQEKADHSAGNWELLIEKMKEVLNAKSN